jgi:hypothetical protein
MKKAPLLLLPILLLALAASPAAGAGLEVLQQAGGEPGPALTVGSHLYQGLGPAIATYSNDTSAPALLDVAPPLPGLVVGLVHSGSHLFAAVRTSYPNGFFAVYSLADPAKPSLVALEDYSNSFLSSPSALIAAGGNLLYLADLEIGILTVDISDPADPDFATGFAGVVPADEMTITGSRLVAWGQNFLGSMAVSVFDISTPATPSQLGSFDGGLAIGGGADGNFFYSIGFGLEIFDFSNLSNVTSVFQNGDPVSRDVLLRSGRLYFGHTDGLHVWDVSTPASASEIALVPAALGRSEQSAVITTGGNPKLIFFTQESRGVRFSVGSPPVLEHTFDLPGAVDATSIADRGDLLFAADFYSGLRTLDRSTLDADGRLDVPSDQLGAVEGLKVVGNRAYIANWGYGLLIADITDPAAPTLLGSVAIDFATAIETFGNYAYVGTSTNGGTLVTVDVSNPASPQIVDTDLTTKAMKLHFRSPHYLFLADESFGAPGGLRIYHLGNPAAPWQMAHYTACDSAAGVDTSTGPNGFLAYLACSDGSLHIINVSTPSTPTQLGVYLAPDVLGDARDVAVRGNYAYLGRGDTVDAVNVAIPASPVFVSRTELGSAARRLVIAPSGQPWVAAGQAGVYQLEVGIFADGFESGNTAAWTSTVP